MGTRSLTVVKNQENKEIAVIYNQFDGYPDGVGKDIWELLQDAKLVNGFQGTGKEVNGMEDCLALLIWNFKNKKEYFPVGGTYIYPPKTRGLDEEYIYILYEKNSQINIKVQDGYGNKALYDGPVKNMNKLWKENKK